MPWDTTATANDLSILFDVWLLSHLSSGLLDDALLETGMSGDEFGMYTLLRGFGAATPSQLSRWTGLRPTTVSAVLKRIAGRGHTLQRRHPEDGRSYLVDLSEAGERAHARTAAAFRVQTEALVELLGANQAALRQALQSLDAVLRQVVGADPRPYRLETATADARWALHYDGAALSPAQEQDVRRYLDFIRSSADRT
jgi:DNA-binding MarR family transcriptional regulator